MPYTGLMAVVTLVLFSATAVPAAAVEVHRDDVPDMMEACQRERQRNLAPLREEAIERCVNRQMQSREECERRNRDYGEVRRNANGSIMPGLFWDLPLCQQADAADRYFRRNPRRDTFTLE